MSALRYTKDHEWVRLDGAVATVGVTDHAQQALGDIVFVELPEPGREVAAGEAVAVVESVKAASDVYAPLAGRVVEAGSMRELVLWPRHAYSRALVAAAARRASRWPPCWRPPRQARRCSSRAGRSWASPVRRWPPRRSR